MNLIVKFFIQILPLYLFLLLTVALPFGLKVKLGGYWFGLIIRCSKKLRSRILSNLELVKHSFQVKNKKLFIKQVADSVGRSLTELIFNKQFLTSKNKIKLENELPKCVLQSKKDNKPTIFVSGHFGQWEAIRILLKKSGFESGAIYRKNKNPFFEKIYLNSIKQGGEPIFPAGLSGTKKMIKHLKSGGILSLLLDQATSDGDDFEFFGLKAKTSKAIAELAIKYKANIIPCYGIRDKDGITIRVVFEDPIISNDPIAIIQKLNDSLESRVRASPTQWHWLHNRWKD